MDVKREVEALRIRITAMEKHIGDAEKIKNDHHKKKTEFRVKTKEFQPIWRCFTVSCVILCTWNLIVLIIFSCFP